MRPLRHHIPIRLRRYTGIPFRVIVARKSGVRFFPRRMAPAAEVDGDANNRVEDEQVSLGTCVHWFSSVEGCLSCLSAQRLQPTNVHPAILHENGFLPRGNAFPHPVQRAWGM